MATSVTAVHDRKALGDLAEDVALPPAENEDVVFTESRSS
jgi:hypothetical protein